MKRSSSRETAVVSSNQVFRVVAVISDPIRAGPKPSSLKDTPTIIADK